MLTHTECSSRANYYYSYLRPGSGQVFSDEVKALPETEQCTFTRSHKVHNFVFCDSDGENKKKLAFIQVIVLIYWHCYCVYFIDEKKKKPSFIEYLPEASWVREAGSQSPGLLLLQKHPLSVLPLRITGYKAGYLLFYYLLPYIH